MDTSKQPSEALSEADLQRYNAADPTAMVSTKPWELVITSPRMRLLAWVAVAVIMAVHIFMSAVVGVGDTGAALTTIDRFAFFGVGVVISIAVFIGLTRPRVRVNEDGVEVRNFIGTRFYHWSVIYGLAFPRGSRMARLELPDFEYVPMWAMQSADRASIVKDVADFRALESQYMPQD
ncbi:MULTISPECIES: PH domain-containing protein [unclassified Corynebacterium]|uniref:PH domain-containing protein n=1 Tax=unclassified Corynebacterium TaxID=2624378 RepID=UPI0029CA7FB6|nr:MULTISPECIES: PH domain-containing protein [unclassified Corynebacterium]WPF65143.1 PH domain-containing protein [Corynebacterium sp. 22KM0430]WPF67639.1 PH domain-containing protein [Corynebacterium sp. 21KM1197]